MDEYTSVSHTHHIYIMYIHIHIHISLSVHIYIYVYAGGRAGFRLLFFVTGTHFVNCIIFVVVAETLLPKDAYPLWGTLS